MALPAEHGLPEPQRAIASAIEIRTFWRHGARRHEICHSFTADEGGPYGPAVKGLAGHLRSASGYRDIVSEDQHSNL